MKEFLAIDLGGGTLKLGLFEPQTDGSLVLKQFAVEPLGIAGLEEGPREDLLKDRLREVLDRMEIRIKGKMEVNFCSPSYQAFSKVFPTPPVEGSKIKQLIEYEAQQNVPFPLDEVTWDYQVLGTKDTGELEVMLLALKKEIVESYNQVASSNNLRVNIVDGSVSALRNSFVHNYGDLDGCTLLLDIGCRTTNIIFIEDQKFYARSVQVGGNAITQEFSKESGMSFDEAEAFKINYGMVYLGEQYAEPEHVHVALVAKQARQVFTRLHQQIMQTIQHYRGQMGGSAPVRVFLAGAGSTLAYTSNFIEEKLNAPVNYFDPFRNIAKGPEVNESVLAQQQHMLGEVAGLGLRNVMEGMTEFNLTPMSEQVSRVIDRKSPYIIAAVYVLGMAFLVHGFYNDKLTAAKEEAMKNVRADSSPFRQKRSTLTTEMEDLAGTREEAEKLKRIFQSRYQWMELFSTLQRTFDNIESKRWHPSTAKPVDAEDVAIWVRGLEPITPGLTPGAGGSGGMDPNAQGGGGAGMGPDPGGGAMQRGAAGAPPNPFGAQQSTNSALQGPVEIPAVSHVLLKLQARNVSKIGSSANSEFASYVQNMIRTNTNVFGVEGTMLTNKIEQVGSTNVFFNFDIVLQLKNPMIQKDLNTNREESGFAGAAAEPAGPSF